MNVKLLINVNCSISKQKENEEFDKTTLLRHVYGC
jgi:hypothetical protein